MSNETRRLGAGAAQFGQSDLAPQENAGRPAVTKPPGAMMQQGSLGSHATESFPQKFVQLVGYRHSDARPFSWIRARPVPAMTASVVSSDDVQPPLG